ncbi:unnamed protein product [Symbiodinium sp. KB8]|nr:unnamed protein product [Symbiodinium sp. KB8]
MTGVPQLWAQGTMRNKFHSKRQRQHVVRKYFQALRGFDKAAVQQHAAHVAGWLAYGPKDYSPKETELRLLSKFLDRLGKGVLPGRLQQALPDVLVKLQSCKGGPRADQAWAHAADALAKKLRKFHCCRPEGEPEDGLRPVAGVQKAAEEEPAAREADRDGLEGDLQPSARGVEATEAPPHPEFGGLQRLFRKKVEWANMQQSERAECLLRAEAVAVEFSQQGIEQGKLTKILYQVAAALAPPRRATLPMEQDGGMEQDPQEAGLESSDSAGGLQRRARKLLLKVLRAWRTNHFDCASIRHILEHVERQIGCFEEQASELRLAASATAWLAIQKEVGRLLEGADALDGLPARRRQLTRPATNWVAKGAKKAAMLTAMKALGGRATYQQLLGYVRQNLHVFGETDPSTIERSLRSFRASAYFELHGKEGGEDVFGLAGPCPRGIRRQKRGFTARLHIRSNDCCCIGPLRSSVEEASADYRQLQEWRADMSPEALFQCIRSWHGAHVVSSKHKPRDRVKSHKKGLGFMRPCVTLHSQAVCKGDPRALTQLSQQCGAARTFADVCSFILPAALYDFVGWAGVSLFGVALAFCYLVLAVPMHASNDGMTSSLSESVLGSFQLKRIYWIDWILSGAFVSTELQWNMLNTAVPAALVTTFDFPTYAVGAVLGSGAFVAMCFLLVLPSLPRCFNQPRPTNLLASYTFMSMSWLFMAVAFAPSIAPPIFVVGVWAFLSMANASQVVLMECLTGVNDVETSGQIMGISEMLGCAVGMLGSYAGAMLFAVAPAAPFLGCGAAALGCTLFLCLALGVRRIEVHKRLSDKAEPGSLLSDLELSQDSTSLVEESVQGLGMIMRDGERAHSYIGPEVAHRASSEASPATSPASSASPPYARRGVTILGHAMGS